MATANGLIFPKASGHGIQIDPADPGFGWEDMLGLIHIRAPGANDPSLNIYRGNLREFQFSNVSMNEAFLEFHVPHDYLLGSDIHIHAHWSQIVVDTGGPAGAPGTVKWSFEASYAKGHQRGAFILPIETSVTQQATAAHQHNLIEVQLSASVPSVSQLDTDDLEPDGIILVRAWRNPGDAADTLNQAPFLHYVDIHYQTTSIGTKQKAPDFYT